jgi:hypothetical protein
MQPTPKTNAAKQRTTCSCCTQSSLQHMMCSLQHMMCCLQQTHRMLRARCNMTSSHALLYVRRNYLTRPEPLCSQR